MAMSQVTISETPSLRTSLERASGSLAAAGSAVTATPVDRPAPASGWMRFSPSSSRAKNSNASSSRAGPDSTGVPRPSVVRTRTASPAAKVAAAMEAATEEVASWAASRWPGGRVSMITVRHMSWGGRYWRTISSSSRAVERQWIRRGSSPSE